MKFSLNDLHLFSDYKIAPYLGVAMISLKIFLITNEMDWGSRISRMGNWTVGGLA
jgi:hypothetical protein